MAKFTVNVPCGLIINDEDAQIKCPVVCAAHMGKWTGKWNTVIPGEMSVCECEYDTEKSGTSELKIMVIAGPIWDNNDAKVKAPIVCAAYGGEWTGQWVTPNETWGKMSLCECRFKIPSTQRDYIFEVKGERSHNKLITIRAISGETWGDIIKRYPAFTAKGLNGISYICKAGEGYLKKENLTVMPSDAVEIGANYVISNL